MELYSETVPLMVEIVELTHNNAEMYVIPANLKKKKTLNVPYLPS